MVACFLLFHPCQMSNINTANRPVALAENGSNDGDLGSTAQNPSERRILCIRLAEWFMRSVADEIVCYTQPTKKREQGRDYPTPSITLKPVFSLFD